MIKYKKSLNEEAEKLSQQEMSSVEEFLLKEDEANKINVSLGLKILKIRTTHDTSVAVTKVKIVSKPLSGSHTASTHEIETSCFKIQFEIDGEQQSQSKSSHFNSDIDNVHTCYKPKCFL
jgi:hypothetical protein